MSNQVADVLDKAADLLTPEGAWTQNDFARTQDGTALLDGNDPDAICWCVMGAIEKVTDDPSGFRSEAAEFFGETVGGNISSFNDASSRTQAEVVAALREAATLARKDAN